VGKPQPANTDQELLEELRRVGSDLGFRMQVRKYLKWILLVGAVFVLVSVASGVALVRTFSFSKQLCENSNKFREAYVNQWEPIIADNPLPDPPPEDALPEIREAYERQKRSTETFVKGLETDFAQQEC
jgi:hypothetical protein